MRLRKCTISIRLSKNIKGKRDCREREKGLREISSYINLLLEFISIFLCERYVFLEKGMETKKQRWYYLLSATVILAAYIFAGEEIATAVLVLAGGFNIVLARKERKLWGFLLILPVMGIVNGLAVPVFFMPADIIAFSLDGLLIYNLAVYGGIGLLLLLFYFKGKEWRKWFQKEMSDRRLQKQELVLLCIVGILMLFYSNVLVSRNLSVDYMAGQYGGDIVGQFRLNIFLMGITAFVLTVVIIVLIMQGNKRFYYYDQALEMRAEVEKQAKSAERRRQSRERLAWQTVQALANTIDAKDAYTNGHSTRVAKYAEMIAVKMGYADEKLEQLRYAALLHDIGKIGIPNEIINKPSRLTDEEYEIIKTHPVIGGNILDEITEIPDITIGARWHHERFDGKGYPDQLKEYEIPELARIIGVADAYDAMTSKRSYRGVLPQEVVREQVEKGKGSQFDPEIADIMLQLMDEDMEYQMHEW